MSDATEHERVDTKGPPRWSRILLWPGFFLLGVHTIVVMKFTDAALAQGNVNGFVRFLGEATVIPTITTALLIAGFISLVLEKHSED